MDKTTLRSICTMLNRATGPKKLKTLTLDVKTWGYHEAFDTWRPEDEFARALGPLMRKLSREHRETDSKEVLKVLRWKVEGHYSSAHFEGQEELIAGFGARVEEILAQTFEKQTRMLQACK